MRRPAAAGGALRRPAAAVGRSRTVYKKLHEEGLRDLPDLGPLHLPKAVYYGREIEVAGQIISAKIEGGEVMADFRVSGTQDESFLRAMSGKPGKIATLHVCSPHCNRALTGDHFIHGIEFKKIGRSNVDWHFNLETVGGEPEDVDDENRKLREAAEGRRREGSEEGAAPKEKKESKKDKEKKKKKDKDADKKKKRKHDESSEEVLSVGQKKAESLYSETGLDPDLKGRSKVLRKAKRIGKKAKKKKKKKEDTSGEEEGSSDSEEDTSTDEDLSTGLFSADRKVRRIAEKCPGALAFGAMMEARQGLLTTSGMSWNMEKKAVSPTFVQYTRQQMSHGMSPPMLQEAMTVSTCLDLLMVNRPAAAADVLGQRLKALESLFRGSHWTVARQVELIRTDQMSLMQENESLEAARRAKEDERLKSLVSARPSAPRGSDYEGRKGGKGKQSKGSPKGRADEGGKGKNKDGRKDDKGSWQHQKKDWGWKNGPQQGCLVIQSLPVERLQRREDLDS